VGDEDRKHRAVVVVVAVVATVDCPVDTLAVDVDAVAELGDYDEVADAHVVLVV